MFANLVYLLPILGFPSVSFAAQQEILKSGGNNPLNANFSQTVHELLELFHVPGVSIAVIDGDDVWAEGYGTAIFPNTPVTPSTLFYTGSTTKAFVAAAMSLLVDDKKHPDVHWNTPISQLIHDDFVLENEYETAHITVEDALSHRSGMPRHDHSYGGEYDGHKGTPRDLVRSMRYLPSTAEPRTRFQYNNMMYATVGHVIETLEGVWLGDFLRERIWKPLGMESTYFSQSEAEQAPEVQAQGYVYYQEKYQEVPFLDLDIVAGAGAMVSNVLDYAKWLKVMIDSSGPISKEGHKELKTSRTFIEKPSTPLPFAGPLTYTLGWFTGVYSGHEVYYHSGGLDGFGAEALFIPDSQFGIVLLGNTATTSNIVEEVLMWYLVDEKIQTPEHERFDWRKKIQTSDIQQAEKYQNSKKSFYPNVPSPKLAPTLPLLNYTGTYYHPGYRNITIFLKDGALAAIRSHLTWKISLDFEHVSGDYFMANIDSITTPGSVFKRAAAAEFVIGADGIPKTFGLADEEEMGLSGRIFFDRISGPESSL